MQEIMGIFHVPSEYVIKSTTVHAYIVWCYVKRVAIFPYNVKWGTNYTFYIYSVTLSVNLSTILYT